MGKGWSEGDGDGWGWSLLEWDVGTKLCEGQAHCRRGCLAALLEEGALDRGGERFWVKRLAQDKTRGHQSGFIQQRGLWPHCWRKEFVATEPGGLRQAFGPGEGDDRGKMSFVRVALTGEMEKPVGVGHWAETTAKGQGLG